MTPQPRVKPSGPLARDTRTHPTATASGRRSIRSVIGQNSDDAWAVAGDGPGYTWTIDNPAAKPVIDQLVGQPNHRRRLDYVFIGSAHHHPDAYCSVRAASLAFDHPFGGIWASDHFGLVIDIEIGREA